MHGVLRFRLKCCIDISFNFNIIVLGFLEHVTVLIGISVNEKPVAGVIHQPYFKSIGDDKKLGRTIWGLQGAGVGGFTLAPPPDSLVITTTRSHSNPVVEQALKAMSASQIVRVGGAGYKVCYLKHLYCVSILF